MQTRSLPVNSVDADKRTVEVVFTTGAAVRRRAWSYNGATLFDEVLEVSRSAVNLDRLNAGGPVLDSHSSYRTSSQVGVIEKAWIAGNEGRALIRFPSKGVDEAADRMFAMVQEGIIRNVSVGYSLDEVRVEEPQKKGDVEKRIATRWTPFEVSFVTVPADAGAQVRGNEETFPVTINRASPDIKEASTMDENETNATTETRTAPAVAVPPVVTSAPAAGEATRAAIEAERARAAEITALGARHNMPAEFVRSHITSGAGIADVRAAVLDAIAARSAETQVSARGVDAQITRDEGDTIRAALETAILHRANPAAVKLDDGARQWRGMSLMEMGRTFHEQTTGERLRGLGKMELASRLLGLDTGLRSGGMLSTSDFPAILANVVSKRLRSAYEVAPQNWKKLSRQNNAPDFKARAIVQLSNLPQLKQIREGGEYSHAALADSKEQYALATYGRVVTITRQALINDDLGAFDRLPMLLGRAAAETEASLFWAIITSNPQMGDGKTLFHSAHNNVGTAGAINLTTLNEARSAMRKQKGLAAKASDPADPLNLTPRYIVVSPDKETEVQQFLHTVLYPQAPDQVNVFAGSLEPVVEARLSGNGWYLFADPAMIDTIEYAYLEGEEGLYTESRLGFEVDGIEIKGRLDFAAKAIDWRGMYENAGN